MRRTSAASAGREECVARVDSEVTGPQSVPKGVAGLLSCGGRSDDCKANAKKGNEWKGNGDGGLKNQRNKRQTTSVRRVVHHCWKFIHMGQGLFQAASGQKATVAKRTLD